MTLDDPEPVDNPFNENMDDLGDLLRGGKLESPGSYHLGWENTRSDQVQFLSFTLR